MRKSFILSGIIGVGVIITSGFMVVDSTGIAGYTGSPHDGHYCNSCHTGGTATTTGSITATPAFGGSGTNLTYVAGTTYTITVTEAGYAHFGFGIEILTGNTSSTTTNAGTMTAISTNCKTLGTAPKNMVHNTPIASSTNATFKWVAPASGTAYLYAAINGVNNDGNTTGDKPVPYSYTLTPATTAGIDAHQSNDVNLTVFPNPATDNVRISYNLKERGTVEVKLYNLNGELVADLLNETQEVGLQNAEAHLPESLAKGLYMVKLSVNGEQTTQKLMVR